MSILPPNVPDKDTRASLTNVKSDSPRTTIIPLDISIPSPAIFTTKSAMNSTNSSFSVMVNS